MPHLFCRIITLILSWPQHITHLGTLTTITFKLTMTRAQFSVDTDISLNVRINFIGFLIRLSFGQFIYTM